jgi:phenylalanyl-tRNA synthetase alpha chain
VLAEIDSALAAVLARIDAGETNESDLVGKRSPFAELKTKLGSLPGDQRAAAGKALGEATRTAAEALVAASVAASASRRAQQLEAERLDLTERLTQPTRGHHHIVTQAWERLEDVFLGMGFVIGPEVETSWFNFTALNMDESHPARSDFDTLFVDWGEPGSTLLRTHTSPVQIRTMRRQQPPIAMVCPGRVFRRDTPDATHMPVFHQIEGLVVDRGITLGDLSGTIEQFVTAFFGPGFTSQLRPSYFPFTEPSAEFDVRDPTSGKWLELGGCGMVHPRVLATCGIDPEEWSGFAFGFGIDRFAKSFHHVEDIREMFTNDIRFLHQF